MYIQIYKDIIICQYSHQGDYNIFQAHANYLSQSFPKRMKRKVIHKTDVLLLYRICLGRVQ